MVDLDFVIGQEVGLPVGMQRHSSAEFRRRILAAALSHQLGLSSVDYTLKRYVSPEEYDEPKLILGDYVSDFLRDGMKAISAGCVKAHQRETTSFGQFGADLTLYRLPGMLDTARMLANRGLFLEVLPILRMCLEMLAWANVSFYVSNEDDVVKLKANYCVSKLNNLYRSAGQIYGYFSKFAHWEHELHGHFLTIENEKIGVISTSRLQRAKSLLLCLIILDVWLEVLRKLYPAEAPDIILEVQDVSGRDKSRATYSLGSEILKACQNSSEIDEILRLMVA